MATRGILFGEIIHRPFPFKPFRYNFRTLSLSSPFRVISLRSKRHDDARAAQQLAYAVAVSSALTRRCRRQYSFNSATTFARWPSVRRRIKTVFSAIIIIRSVSIRFYPRIVCTKSMHSVECDRSEPRLVSRGFRAHHRVPQSDAVDRIGCVFASGVGCLRPAGSVGDADC